MLRASVKLRNFGNISAEFVLDVMSIGKPKLEIKQIKVESLTSIAYIPSHTWTPIKIIIENLEPYSNLVGYQIQKQMNAYDGGNDDYKFDITILSYDDNKLIDKTIMIDCFLQDINYNLNPYNDECETITLTVAYNDAKLELEDFE